tara:strand:+ start:395 stop:1126 length:732 start_codon:yes stop_codon:yes gene_type:complete
MNDYYHLYLNNILEKLKVAEVLPDPFPHMILDLDYHIDYTKFDVNQNESFNGRAASDVIFSNHHEDTFDDRSMDVYEKKSEIKKIILEKFDLEIHQEQTKELGEFTTYLWEDTFKEGGDATDIHIDFLHPGNDDYKSKIPYPVVTMQTYVPPTNDYIDIGTSFYKYVGDDIFKDAFIPHELPYEHPCNAWEHRHHTFQMVKSIPFQNGITVLHSNTNDAWHSMTQDVPKNYKRVSLGSRIHYL